MPAGSDSYQPWTSGNRAPTLRQEIDDVDFDVVTVFASTPSARFQMQGLLVADTNNDFLRFDVHWEGTAMRAFAADPRVSGAALINVEVPNATHARYVRVTRTGDTWELRTSSDGNNWTSHGTFVRAMTVTEIGVFAGNATPTNGGTAPAYTGVIDYFGPLPIPAEALGAPTGVTAVALAPTESGGGYLILLSDGTVVARGDATHLGDLSDPSVAALLVTGERPTAISLTTTGAGYWIFTNLGRALIFGDAVHSGDLPALGIVPDRDVVSSAATANGYYMLGADGGVFSFGDAVFQGSLPQLIPADPLACEIVGLVPTPGGDGYWMVGCDGGVFAFGEAFFVGSVPGILGATTLAAPVNGIVAYGGGYLMVASDGGAFNFGAPFFGSLGAVALNTDIVGIAAAAPFATNPNVALANLTVAPKTGSDSYDRDQWNHWTDDDNDCQDTRQEVLLAEALTITSTTAGDCRVTLGQWVGLFTGTTVTDPSALDVDHMVPLKNAHESGGWAWNSARKQAFANDLAAPQALIAVTASANRSKGARGPEEWKPPDTGYWCTYATDWIVIKTKWTLTITSTELSALAGMLDTCSA